MKKIFILTLMALMLVSLVSAVVGPSVDPVFVAGNPTCADIGNYDHELKIDPPTSGVYGQITFTKNADGKHFDWSSTIPIDAVIAKGGNNAHAYYYNPASMGDYYLVSPLNNGGQVPALSHAVFCWNDSSNDVPEFGLLGASVLVAGLIGFILFKRK